MTIHRLGDHLAAVPDEPDEDDDPGTPKPLRRLDWEKYIRRAGLPSLTKLVALTLASYGNMDGRDIFPGDDNLAADCGIKKRALINHRHTLEQLGFLIRVADAKPGRNGRAVEYRLSWPPNFNRLPGSRGPDGGPAIDLH